MVIEGRTINRLYNCMVLCSFESKYQRTCIKILNIFISKFTPNMNVEFELSDGKTLNIQNIVII